MADTVSTPLGDIPSFIFGGTSGIPTYEELKRRRAMAVARAAQGQRGFPTTLGAGIASLGEAVGQRMESSQLDEAERALEERNKRAVWDVQNPGVPYPGAGTGPSAAVPDRSPIVAALAGPPPNPTLAAGDTTSPQGPTLAAGGLPAEYAAAIAGIESSGGRDPYTVLGAVTPRGDRAFGKYQVMGANIPEWTQAALGQRLTPQQFLASKEAQDRVFQHRFGDYVAKYGPEGAARAWYAGEKGMLNPNATDQHRRLTVRGYGQDFMRRAQDARTAEGPEGALPPDTGPAAGVGVDENPPTPTTIAPMRVAGPVTAPTATTTPGYEMPEPRRATPPRPMPMDTREITLRRSLPLMHPESPQYRATEQIIKEYDQRRGFHDQREIERSKAEDTLYNTLLPKYQEFQAGREKRALDLIEQQNKIAREGQLKLGEKERIILPDGKGGFKDMTPPRPGTGSGIPDVKMTGEQAKTFDNLQKAEVAIEYYRRIPDVDKVLTQGLRDELAGKVPFFNNALLSSRYARARNAALNVASAHLREISGAAIGVAEEAKTIAQLFPMYGEDATLTKQKRRILDAVVSGMSMKLGAEVAPMVDYARKQRAVNDAVEQQKMRDEMAGVGVPEIGKVYVDKDKSGKVISRRFWTGSRWEDD